MTACNLIVQPDAAYLITDTAVYDDRGTILGFQGKVLVLAQAIMQPGAIAFTGQVLPQDLAPALAALDPRSTLAVIEALPDLLIEGERSWRRRTGASRKPESLLAVAGFDIPTEQAFGYVAANGVDFFPAGSGYEPYTARRVRWHVVVDHVAAFGVETTLDHPAEFDPMVSGAALLAQQRRELVDRAAVIGGQGFVTSVSVAGAESIEICSWEDAVGSPIAVEAAHV